MNNNFILQESLLLLTASSRKAYVYCSLVFPERESNHRLCTGQHYVTTRISSDITACDDVLDCVISFASAEGMEDMYSFDVTILPPSKVIVAPFTKAPARLLRNRHVPATSSGVPILLRGNTGLN